MIISVENAEVPRKNKKKFIYPKKTADEIKKEKEQRRLRKARIILRNLSYKTTEQKLKDEFSKYGAIKECNLMKRTDGKLVGCAFIQYEKVNQAAKAIHHSNAKEFLGRPVVIDWAVSRKKFVEHLNQNQRNQKKNSTENNNEISIKTEIDDDSVDEENGGTDDDDNGQEEQETDGESDDEENEDISNDEYKEDTKDDIKIDPDASETKPKHKLSNDIAEGCTVFIKNIPFEATNDDLRKVCRQFGPLYYALITTDKVSGHSKGNGFAKFKVFVFVE